MHHTCTKKTGHAIRNILKCHYGFYWDTRAYGERTNKNNASIRLLATLFIEKSIYKFFKTNYTTLGMRSTIIKKVTWPNSSQRWRTCQVWSDAFCWRTAFSQISTNIWYINRIPSCIKKRRKVFAVTLFGPIKRNVGSNKWTILELCYMICIGSLVFGPINGWCDQPESNVLRTFNSINIIKTCLIKV